jgi:hypothetical protein
MSALVFRSTARAKMDKTATIQKIQSEQLSASSSGR